MGNLEHGERTLAAAEKGYSELLRLFSQAKGLTAELEKEFHSKFKHLRACSAATEAELLVKAIGCYDGPLA